MAASDPEALPAPDARGPLSIRLDEVHVVYRVYEQRHMRFRDVASEGFRSRRFREIHAVRGVSLDVHAGEVVGVIGPNGAGKSTLLSAVSGLLPVTRGAVYARSQPSFLGVGAALNKKLSGRQNVFIGGLALGLSSREIRERFDDIVRYAGLRRFIDMPLKTYSSGMRARLQFAIATAVIPEILLIDEALAVGDRKFKRRSARKIDQIRADAGTVLLVSHSLDEIARSCTRALWLESGVVRMDGPPGEVIAAYTAAEDATEDSDEAEVDAAGAARRRERQERRATRRARRRLEDQDE